MTSTGVTEDARIRRLRPPKVPVDPFRPLGIHFEEERCPGGLEPVLTVFLTGSECPFTCSFCDLWRHTLDTPTPLGALPRQLGLALAEARSRKQAVRRIKLYNAGSFFDARAVPLQDRSALAALLAPFHAITVECHARLVGPECRDFANRLAGRLEIAVGLETVHPQALRLLNKKMTLQDFDRAALLIRGANLDLRAFVLVGVPFVPPAEALDWAVRSVDYALDRGASSVVLIPVRGGNGELECLAAKHHFRAPTLADLEAVLAASLQRGRGIVRADLWDVGRLEQCPSCGPERLARIRRMNATGMPEPSGHCDGCREAPSRLSTSGLPSRQTRRP